MLEQFKDFQSGDAKLYGSPDTSVPETTAAEFKTGVKGGHFKVDHSKAFVIRNVRGDVKTFADDIENQLQNYMKDKEGPDSKLRFVDITDGNRHDLLVSSRGEVTKEFMMSAVDDFGAVPLEQYIDEISESISEAVAGSISKGSQAEMTKVVSELEKVLKAKGGAKDRNKIIGHLIELNGYDRIARAGRSEITSGLINHINNEVVKEVGKNIKTSVSMKEAKDYKALSKVITKRKIMDFDAFKKNSVDVEKGEEELVKASVSPAKEGPKGYVTLDENENDGLPAELSKIIHLSTTDKKRYDHMMDVLPPMYVTEVDGVKVNGGYAVSEPYSEDKGRPTFSTYFKFKNQYYTCMTVLDGVTFENYNNSAYEKFKATSVTGKDDSEANESAMNEAAVKTFIVKITRDKGRGEYRTTYWKGTLEQLTQAFSYTLEIGNSHKSSINRNPKTIAAFMKALGASYDEKEAALYNRTSIDLVTEIPSDVSSDFGKGSRVEDLTKSNESKDWIFDLKRYSGKDSKISVNNFLDEYFIYEPIREKIEQYVVLMNEEEDDDIKTFNSQPEMEENITYTNTKDDGDDTVYLNKGREVARWHNNDDYGEITDEDFNKPIKQPKNRKMTQDDWDQREEQEAYDREANG